MAGEQEEEGWRQRPIPDLVLRTDPTELTKTAIREAKEDLRREINSLREILEARMRSMDHERKLMVQVMDERAEAINRRFAERDERFSERDQARTEAVHAALTAGRELNDCRDTSAERAISKFEVSVKEQINQIGELAESGRQQLSTQLQALKERLDRAEGVGAGAAGYRTERRLDTSAVVAALAVLVAVASILLAAFKH